MKKVQLSLAEDLVTRMDKYGEENYFSRSGLVTVALTQYLNANEIKTALVDMALSMRKIADNNAVDEETLEKLKDLERVAMVFAGSLK